MPWPTHAVRWRTIDVAVAQGHGPFDRALDLLGDGSIRCCPPPATPTATSRCCCALPASREILLTGDAAYARQSIERRWVPLIVEDVPAYQRSLEMLAAWAAQHPEALP